MHKMRDHSVANIDRAKAHTALLPDPYKHIKALNTLGKQKVDNFTGTMVWKEYTLPHIVDSWDDVTGPNGERLIIGGVRAK